MSELASTPQALPTQIRLVGGPPMWDGATLNPETVDFDDLYAILQVTDGTQLPERAEGEDFNPSAVYGPIPTGTHPQDVSEWYFRGWWPHSPTDPSPRHYLADYLLTKAAQPHEQAPGWLDRHYRFILEVAAQCVMPHELEMAVRLRQSLHTYLSQGPHLELAVHNAERAASVARVLGHPGILVEALIDLSSAHRRNDDHDQAIAAVQEALGLEGLTPDQEAHARYTLSMSLAWAGQHTRALEGYEHLHAHRGDLDEGLRGAVDNGLAWSLSEVGRPREALPHAQRALAWAREEGDERTLAAALDTVGQVQSAAGDVDGARAAYQEALELYRAINYRVRIDQVLDAMKMLQAQG